MRVAFIGLGIMGSRMARNLIKQGTDLTVYNRSESASNILEQAGAKKAASGTEAVSGCDYVFTMLTDPEAVRQVMISDKGCLLWMKKNALWIDLSTVNPSFSRECGDKAKKLNLRFMDAPVSGSLPQAEKGELVFLAGGAESDLKESEPFLRQMGNKIIHAGEVGMGSSLKLLVNSTLAQAMLAFAENVCMGERLGFRKEFLLDTLSSLPVSAPFLKAKAERIRSMEFLAQFPLEHMHKDLQLLKLTAYENKVQIPMASLAEELYAGAKNYALPREDFSAIYKFLDQLT